MKKILVVNTLKPFFEGKKDFLLRSDLSFYYASMSEEVLKIHRAESVDLIIIDLTMPGMGGDGLSSFIRWIDSLKKVSIIIVCDNNPASIERCLNSGANAHVTKPIDPNELFTSIRKLLDVRDRRNLRIFMQTSVKGAFRDNLFFSTAQNISTSGVLLESEKLLSKGDRIVCSFFLSSNQLTLNGEVIRTETISPLLFHYGVQFVSPDHSSVACIDEFVRSGRN